MNDLEFLALHTTLCGGLGTDTLMDNLLVRESEKLFIPNELHTEKKFTMQCIQPDEEIYGNVYLYVRSIEYPIIKDFYGNNIIFENMKGLELNHIWKSKYKQTRGIKSELYNLVYLRHSLTLKTYKQYLHMYVVDYEDDLYHKFS